ncbi:MAG: DnaA/Hda family protein [Pseudomonadota bacterium]|nr:DnaA/Hda family protein [Pseudomonadota bacterium]
MNWPKDIPLNNSSKANQRARHAAHHILNNSCSSCDPVFIHSHAGNGKTHLLHAIGNRVKRDSPDMRVLQIHTQRFVAELRRAIRQNTIDEFRAFFQGLDVLLIDDIEFLAGKERSQRELSYILGALVKNQKQIVITGQTTPQEAKGINEHLKFILDSGVTVYMASPDLMTRIEILKRKARDFDCELSDDVAFLIANSLYACVRELESVLRRVVAHAVFEGKSITLDTTRRVLAKQGYIRLEEAV